MLKSELNQKLLEDVVPACKYEATGLFFEASGIVIAEVMLCGLLFLDT